MLHCGIGYREVGADQATEQNIVISPYLLRPLRPLDEVQRALAARRKRVDAPATSRQDHVPSRPRGPAGPPRRWLAVTLPPHLAPPIPPAIIGTSLHPSCAPRP